MAGNEAEVLYVSQQREFPKMATTSDTNVAYSSYCIASSKIVCYLVLYFTVVVALAKSEYILTTSSCVGSKLSAIRVRVIQHFTCSSVMLTEVFNFHPG